MKINFNSPLKTVHSKMSKLTQRTAAIIENQLVSIKEARINRYINFRNRGTYTSPIVTDLYNMREPLANFAKAHNITIDVYNPQILAKEEPSIEGIPERFALLVSNPKNNKMKVEIFDGNPSASYPKERYVHYMVNIPGEDTQRTPLVKSTVEDDPMTHVFRTLEAMVKFVK